MKKSSSAIALVLVSAIVLPLGCSKENECKDKLPNGKPNPNCAGTRHGGRYGHGGSFVHLPGFHGGTGGSKSTGGGSSRGGFGGSGGGHASS